MLILLAAITALFSSYLYLASPSRAAKLAGDLLTAMVGADVQIESAHFGLDGMITLNHVEMRIGSLTGNQSLLFDAQRVLIKHSLVSLLRGAFRPRTLRFINPTMHLTEIVDSNRFNFQYLEQKSISSSDTTQLPRHLPEIILRNGRILRGQVQDDRFTALGSVYLGGKLNPAPDVPGNYYFSLRQERSNRTDNDSVLVINGQLDMRKLKLVAKIEKLALEGQQWTMLPKQLRDWWDQLEPVGSLPSVQFGYDPDPNIGLNAELELSGLSMTLPYGELDSRMTNVSGRFKIVNQIITVTDLKGQIEELQYVINGQVHGFNRDAPFELSVQTDPFAIPEKPRYLLALPTAVQKQFKRFTPSGTFQAQAVVQRVEPAGRLIYDGTVQLTNAKLRYHQFRYPLEGVRGVLRFNDKRIELVNVQGRGPTGANVTVTGIIAPPKDGAAVHVVVTAVNSPVDHVLYDAMPEKRRPILDLFFNKPAHQRLLDMGLIQTHHQQEHWIAQLDQLRSKRQDLFVNESEASILEAIDSRIAAMRAKVEVPVFELGGRATVIAQTSRALGPDQPFRTTVGLDVSGVNALYEYWPYPLRGRGGKLLIKPDEVVVDQIELEGIGGAIGKITGEIIFEEKNEERQLNPNLDVVINHLPCDDLLFASIPPPQDYWPRHLALGGNLDVSGQIYRNDQHDKIVFQFDSDLSDGHIQPNNGQFVAEQIAGSVMLSADRIEFRTLEGAIGSGRLTLAGHADWTDQQTQLDLQITATDVAINRSILDVFTSDDPVRQDLSEFYETYQPSGQVDAKIAYRIGADSVTDYRLDLQFEQLNFWLEDLQVVLQNIQGNFSLTPEYLELDGWGGSFGTGDFSVSGSVGYGEHRYYDLTFDAQSGSICPTTRAMLPDAVLQVIDGLVLDGAYDMKDAQFVYRPHEAQPMFNFRSTARLTDAMATVGIPISKMDGDIQIRATRRADSEWPRMDLRFDCPHLLAAGRAVSPLALHIASDDEPDRLSIQDLRGTCYGGTLLGSGEIELDDQGLYRMNLVLQDVSLHPFVYGESLDDESSQDPKEVETPSAGEAQFTGLLAASLTIEGTSHGPSGRRGRGDLVITDANLYEVPLSLALIQILNLSLPASRSFDRASASYLIEDDLVLLDSIRFEAPTIEIAGTGLMQYSTLDLDLDLYTRNPGSRKFGMLADLLGVFKDELLSIHVTGTLDDPKPKATSFQGLRRSWQDVFGKGRHRDQRLLSGVRGEDATPGQ